MSNDEPGGDVSVTSDDWSRSRSSGATATPYPTFADGRYVTKRLLGEGGQKIVYQMRDLKLDRDVVIAVLKAGGRRTAAGRLLREARALARLGDHPHIVTIYDVAEERGQPYIVAQFVDGGSLDQLRRRMDPPRLTLTNSLKLGQELCQALQHAHQHGIVHRDLKPGNIWLTRDGASKLGDFGLAADLEVTHDNSEGLLLGTVAYMAPEQALGLPVGPQADLYSLGIVLYELLTGRRPFVGDTVQAILSQHLHAAPVAPSWHVAEIPPVLDRLILTLLAKSPEERPPSAESVRQALAAITEPARDEIVTTDKHARPLDRLAAGVFVGRARELALLKTSFKDALSGQGGLVLLVGEPGSGKTSTAEQLLTYALLRGAHVLRAHCYEGEGAPAYWPWVQILRAYVANRSPEETLDRMGPAAAVIAQLDPEIGRQLPPLPPCPPLEPGPARFRLFDSVSSFLKKAAQKQALVLFIDDLHWADAASLLLLQFLVHDIRGVRLLVIATFRDLTFGREHPLGQMLGALAGQGIGERVLLHGLTEADVGQFIEITAGVEPPERLVKAVCRETEGNPFFVQEVVRLLVTTGQLERAEQATSWSIALPQGVREVLTRRLSHLSDDAHRVLVTASVIGREFNLDALSGLGELDADRLVDLVEEAIAARLVTEEERMPGHYRFSHALIRETLYDGLTPTRRTRLHRRIGEVLEKLYEDRLDPHLVELSHHFSQAVGQADKAIDYAIRAGDRCDRLLAYEEAASQYELALRTLEDHDPDQTALRSELLVRLGEVQTKSGASVQARESFRRAATFARTAQSAATFARAAIGLGAGTAARTKLGHAIDDLEIGLLQEALEKVGEADTPLRARLLAQLALALYHSPAERAVLSAQAVDISRRAGDPAALLAALYSRCVALEGFDKAEERLVLATEMVQIAERSGDAEMALRGHFRRYREFIELGDLASVERELQTYTRLAEDLRQPRYLWYVPYCQASLAAFRGEFAPAETLLEQALAVGRRAQDPNATLFCTLATYSILFHRGRFDEIERILQRFIDAYPSTGLAWRIQLARLYCYMDRPDEARRLFDAVAKRDFDDLQIDGSFVSTLVALCVLCWHVQDRRRGEKLYVRLQPFAERILVAGNSANAGGAVSHALAIGAATLERWQESDRLFKDAIEKNTRLGARPWLAWTEYDHAQVLAARGQRGDDEKARAALERARAVARDLDMVHILASHGNLAAGSAS